jgi:mono/diheme cytochrome c family protein
MSHGDIRRNGRVRGALLAALIIIGLGPVRADNGGASMSGPTRFTQLDGPGLFQAVCQGCHMQNAQGAVGAAAYPALAHNKKLAAAAYPVYTVMKGRKGMPALASYLSDEQIATVVTYVRTHFGNDYTDKISPAMVKAARETP